MKDFKIKPIVSLKAEKLDLSKIETVTIGEKVNGFKIFVDSCGAYIHANGVIYRGIIYITSEGKIYDRKDFEERFEEDSVEPKVVD